ncbi:MAG TPA: CHAT domain-containing protein [Polyangium sp.]|nr:CHAT domain-containing protein [Polyangium sp.]
MLRSLSKLLVFVGALAFVTPAYAVSPVVHDEINVTRNELPSILDVRDRTLEKFIGPLEKVLVKWEKFAARKGLSADDQAAIDATTVELLNMLAFTHIELGNLAAAEPYALRATILAAKLSPTAEYESCFALTTAGKLRMLQGKYAEAKQFFEKALVARKHHVNSFWEIRILYYEYAQLKKILGDFGGARELLEKLDKSSEEEAAKVARAGVNLVAGQYNSVEALLEPAVQALEYRGSREPAVINAWGNWADYALILGLPEQAEVISKKLLERREKLPYASKFDIADSHIRLARVYIALDNLDKSVFHAEQAEKILQAITAPEHPARIPLQVVQGEIHAKKRDLPAAEKVFQLAYTQATTAFGADNYTTATILSRLGALQFANRELEAAYTSTSRAAEALENALGPTHPDTCAAQDTLARIYLAQNKPNSAITVLYKAMDGRDRHALQIFSNASEVQKTRVMEELRGQTQLAVEMALAMPESQDAAKLALTAVLRRKGKVLDGMAQSRAALRNANSPDDVVLMERIVNLQRQIVALLIRGPQGRTAEQHREMIRALDIEKQKLEAQESRKSQSLLIQENPVTVEEVAVGLPKGAALVEYAQISSADGKNEPRYVAWVLSRDVTVRFLDLGSAEKINTLVTRAREALADSKADPKPIARLLDAAIMQPVRRALETTQWLFISPDADVNLVPFAALRDEFDHWLLDAYSFTYLTSGRDLLLGETIDEPKEPGAPAVLMGNPDFGEKKLGRRRFAQRDGEAPAAGPRATDITRIKFNPLKGTTAEIEAIQKRIPGSQVFMGEKATESEVKAVKHPRILHLATHGFFLPDKPSAEHPDEDAAAFRTDNPLVRAGLALAGANLLRSGEEDGVLTAYEAAALDLYGTKLVVLSACETGIGQARSGEGVYGLRRALAMAGAETTVMSLWPVDDNGTKELMIGYYDRLMNGGGRSESLRQAALSLKSQTKFAHPFYWASFIVSGDSTALSGKLVPPGPAPVAPSARGCACEMSGGANEPLIPASSGILGVIAAMRLARRRGGRQLKD